MTRRLSSSVACWLRWQHAPTASRECEGMDAGQAAMGLHVDWQAGFIFLDVVSPYAAISLNLANTAIRMCHMPHALQVR